jgi:hypothetical protein
LQESLPLQDNNQQELQQQQPQQQAATILAAWGFQIWSSVSLPLTYAMLHEELVGEDAGMAVVLQLVAAGAVDPGALGQIQGSISTSREDALEATVDSAAGALVSHVGLGDASIFNARCMNCNPAYSSMHIDNLNFYKSSCSMPGLLACLSKISDTALCVLLSCTCCPGVCRTRSSAG